MADAERNKIVDVVKEGSCSVCKSPFMAIVFRQANQKERDDATRQMENDFAAHNAREHAGAATLTVS